MSQQEVKIVFKIEGLEGYISDLETLNEVLDKVQASSKDAARETDKLEKETKEANEQTGFLGRTLNDIKDTFQGFKSDFKLLTNGIKTFFTTGTAGAKALKIAFASTGIGLLVIAVASLIEYFRNTEEGSKKLQVIFTAFGVIINRLVGFISDLGGKLLGAFKDPKQAMTDFVGLLQNLVIKSVQNFLSGIGKLGEALVSLFSGDFSQALDLAKQGVVDLANSIPLVGALGEVMEGVADEINNAVDASTKLVNAQRDLEKLTNKLAVDQAKLNKELEINQRIAEDTTLSYDERRTALDKVNAANIQLAQNEKKLADARVLALQAELAVTSSDEERRRIQGELAQAQAEAIQKETELGIKRQEAAKLDRELTKEEADRKKALKDIIDGINGELIEDERAQVEESIRVAREAAIVEATNLRASKEEIDQINKAFDDLRDKQLKDIDDKEKLAAEEKAKTITDVLAAAGRTQAENEYQRLQDELEAQRLADVEKLKQAGATQEQLAQLDQFYADKKKKLDEDELQRQKALEQELVNAKLQIVSQSIDAIAALQEAFGSKNEKDAEKNFKIQKALSLASATVRGVEGVLNAYTTAQASPITTVFPAYPVIQASLAGAFAAAQIATIARSKFSPQGGSTPPPTNNTGGGSTNVNPSQAMTARNPQLKFGQEAGETITLGNGSKAPVVKAYVVSTEITSQQSADAKLEQLSRL